MSETAARFTTLPARANGGIPARGTRCSAACRQVAEVWGSTAKPIAAAELNHMLDGRHHEVTEVAPLPSLHRMEWEYINRVLRHTGGNISAAARLLGVERSTLQRKLRKHPPSR